MPNVIVEILNDSTIELAEIQDEPDVVEVYTSLGTPGVGVPAGGSDGQVLTKTSAEDYATAWETPAAGGAGGVTDGDKGDIIISESGTVYTIDAGSVTAAKVAADVATQAELDAEATARATADGLRLLKAGDTMTGSLGIGATAAANAILDINSTTKAFLPPRMTTAQRDAIATPSFGMVVYNTTTSKLNLYTTTWQPLVLGNATINSGTTNPTSPATGDLFVNLT